jgi:hypothetical protein
MSAVSSSRITYEQRWREVQTKLRTLEEKIGILSPIHFFTGGFHEIPGALNYDRAIRLPSWFLLKPEDIPPDLYIDNLNDARLRNPLFLNRFRDHINIKIIQLGLASICAPADADSLRRLIELLKDPSQFEKAKDFLLAHELAHLFHSQEMWRHQEVGRKAVGGMMTAAVIMLFIVAFCPLIHPVIFLSGYGVVCIITVASVCTCLKLPWKPTLSAIEQEKEADLDAADTLGDASGGIYWFKNEMVNNLHCRRRFPELARHIDGQGNNTNDKGHPPHSERVAYLSQWQAQRV